MQDSNPFTNPTHTVNPDINLDPPSVRFPEAAQEAVRRGGEAAREAAEKARVSAKEVTEAAKDATQRATEAAKHIYRFSAVKAEETFAISKEYVRRNPVPVFLGAVAVGAALGYMVMMSRRKPTFGERYAEEPMVAMRDAILGALAPVTQRVHSGYDSAIDGAGKAMHRLSSGRAAHTFSDRLGRIGENLKFW